VVYSSGATPAIQSGSSLAVGLNSVVIRVTTLYGTTKDYTVKVYKKPPTPAWNTSPSSPTISGKPFTNAAPGSITLNWTAVSGTNAADGYEVCQNTQPSTIYGGNTYLVSGQGTTNRAVSLAADNKYYFYIRAYKTTAGKTVYSDYSTADNAAQTISTWYSLDNLAHNETSVSSPFSYSPGMTGYDLLNVKYRDAETIDIIPTYGNDIASVKVNGITTTSGATAAYPMNDDTFSANIPIVVQAQHPSYSKTYTINVTRRGIRIGTPITGEYDYATLSNALSVRNTLYLDEGQTIPVTSQISVTNGIHTLRTVPGQAGVVTINVTSDYGFVTGSVSTTLNLGASGVSTPITITGWGSYSQPTGSLLIANPNNSVITVNMYSGVILQNTKNAISMSGSSSVFNFYGGLIWNCNCAVYNLAGSRVNQYGGAFTGNNTNIYNP
jgi:hypothetical protein